MGTSLPQPGSIQRSMQQEEHRVQLFHTSEGLAEESHDERSLKSCSSNQTLKSPSALHTISRRLGFEYIYAVLQKEFRGRSLSEPKKKVIHNGFPAAFYSSLIHIIPILTCLVLVTLNFHGYYIGLELSGPSGQDNVKLLILQVVAKGIELVAVASLSCIMFALVRYHLLSDSLPFGALTAGFEFSKLSYLWSKEFSVTCSSKFRSKRHKTLLISSIVVFALLSLGIGPAAAVAGQPTIRNWPAGGTSFSLNSTWEKMFPMEFNQKSTSEAAVCLGGTSNTPCIEQNYKLIADLLLSGWSKTITKGQILPVNTLIAGPQGLRQLATRLRGPFVYSPATTCATAAMANIADAVGNIAQFWTMGNHGKCHQKKGGFCYYNDIFFKADAVQPVTFVACMENVERDVLRFPDLNPVPTPNSEKPTLKMNEDLLNKISNSTLPLLEWIDLPRQDTQLTKSGSLGAVISLPLAPQNATQPRPQNQILTCTLDVRWANSTVTGSFLQGPRVIYSEPKEWFTSARFDLNSKKLKWPQIAIQSSWAASQFNPLLQQKEDTSGSGELENNMTAFAMLANSVARGVHDITKVPAHFNAVEAILAVIVTEGISRHGETQLIKGDLKENWEDELFPSRSVFGDGGSAFTSDNTSTNLPRQDEVFDLKVSVNGYGYGITTATLLSCILLLIYTIIATSFVVLTFVTRETSSAWESISEVVALAASSSSFSDLDNEENFVENETALWKNTGAGIYSCDTLKSRVFVGVEGHKKLRMAFWKGDDGRREREREKALERIGVDESYC